MPSFLLRVGPIGLGDRDTYTVHTGLHEWRRAWWRIWVRHRYQPVIDSLTLKWLRRLAAGLLAELALHEEGTIAACESLVRLNRHAKVSAHPDEVYQLKHACLRELYRWYECTVTAIEQVRRCNACVAGVHHISRGRAVDCYRCGGTGIYSRTPLYLLAFDVHGRRYAWHQLARQWPELESRAAIEPGEYVAPRASRDDRLGPFAYEIHCETVARWTDDARLTLGLPTRTQLPPLRRCLTVDWWQLQGVVARWWSWQQQRRRARAAVAEPTLDDSLPF